MAGGSTLQVQAMVMVNEELLVSGVASPSSKMDKSNKFGLSILLNDRTLLKMPIQELSSLPALSCQDLAHFSLSFVG